jgi:hypothetical protein
MAAGNRLSKKDIQKIREKVKEGSRTKRSIAKEYNVCYRTIWKYTKDMPKWKGGSKDNNGEMTAEKKKEIRDRVREMNSKKAVAKEMNLSYGTILSLTKDIKLPSKWGNELIKEIKEKGYAFCSGKPYTFPRRILMAKYPEVKTAKSRGILIIYLESRKEEAAMALIKRVKNKRKTLSAYILKQITKQFGIELDPEEKKDLTH